MTSTTCNARTLPKRKLTERDITCQEVMNYKVNFRQFLCTKRYCQNRPCNCNSITNVNCNLKHIRKNLKAQV